MNNKYFGRISPELGDILLYKFHSGLLVKQPRIEIRSKDIAARKL